MSDETPTPTLAQAQAELAETRTLLALDRTLLAWVRTSLSLNAFGFTLARFIHDLVKAGNLPSIDAQYPRTLGYTLMLLGTGGLLCGAVDHWRSVKRVRSSMKISTLSASLLVAFSLSIISMFLMYTLINEVKAQ